MPAPCGLIIQTAINYQLIHLNIQLVRQSLSQFPVTPLQSTGSPQSNATRISSSCLPCQLPPLSISSSSHSVSQFPHCPWGLQLKASFYMTQESFLNKCPGHFSACILICAPNGFCCASLHSSSLATTLDQKILKNCHKAHFYKRLQVLCDTAGNPPHFQPSMRTGLRLLLKIINFPAIYIVLAFHIQ
jgi:hypothetical protein